MLTTAIRKEPEGVLNYFELGEVYAAQKRYRSAIEAYQKVVDIAPKGEPLKARAQDEINRLRKMK